MGKKKLRIEMVVEGRRERIRRRAEKRMTGGYKQNKERLIDLGIEGEKMLGGELHAHWGLSL